MVHIRNGKRFNIYAQQEIDGVTYPDFTNMALQLKLGITTVEPVIPADFSDDTYTVQEITDDPYVVYEKKPQEQLDALAVLKEKQRIDSLWEAAYAYEHDEVSGSAVALLSAGFMQSKPKSIAITMWCNAIWNGENGFYARRNSGSTDTDFSSVGPIPYTIPELSAEVLG